MLDVVCMGEIKGSIDFTQLSCQFGLVLRNRATRDLNGFMDVYVWFTQVVTMLRVQLYSHTVHWNCYSIYITLKTKVVSKVC